MKQTKRTFLVTVLTMVAFFAICAFAVSCSGGSGSGATLEDPRFKTDIPTETHLSSCIDLDDYIVKIDGATTTVTVTYYNPVSDKNVTETFTGNNMVFYPKIVGEHTIVYTVSKGDATKSTAPLKISVIADPPTITISHTAQTISMPDSGEVTRSFDWLMSNASMNLKPVTSTTKVSAASYRAINVGIDCVNAEWEDLEVSEGAETFTFSNIGEYKFTVRAESDGNFSEDYFLVNVIKDPTEGTAKRDGTKVVEKGKGVVYAENDPYTFKLMSSSLSDINYAVVADKLGDGKKLSLIFKGKNVPQLGFYVIPDVGSGDEYNIKTTKGGFFSFVAKESSGHKWVFFFPNMLTGNAARTPIPGTNDFGVNDLDENSRYLMQYSLSKVAYVEARDAWRLKVNVEIYEVKSYSTENENSECVIGDKLHEIGIEGEFYYAKGQEFDFDQGSSVIYGDIRNNIDIQYISDDRNIKKAPKEETQVAGTDNVYSYKSSATQNADGSITAVLKQGKISDDKETGVTDQLGYVGITDSGFGMGTTMTIDFEGKNLPGIGIYLGKSPEGYAVGGATASGTGFYIGNGNVSGELSSIGQRLIVNGPNRLDPGGKYRGNDGYPPYYGRIDKLSYLGSAASGDPNFNRSAEMGYNLLEEGKKYRFELTDVSAEASDDFKVFALNYKLYDMSGETPILLVDVTKSVDRSFDVVDFNSQTIAFFSSIHQNIRFTYSLSGERINYPYETEIDPDAITLAPAVIRETKNAEGLVTFSGTYSYQGLGRYNVGDVLEFRFTGRNIPNVGLFTDKNGVNAVGGGTENTGIFLQTSGHGASAYDKRLYITGPYLIDAGNTQAYSNIPGFKYREWLGANCELGVDVSYEVDGGRFSRFGIAMLDPYTKYIYRVSTSASDAEGKVIITCELYSVDKEELVPVAKYEKEVTHYLPSLENTYATVYGAGSFSNKDITFAYTVKSGSDVNPGEETITLNCASITEKKEGGKVVGYSGTYDYKGFGEYKVGDTLVFIFKGQNIPNVGLFVNKNGVNPIGGGTENTGIFLQTSGHGAATYNKRLYITGPYLVDAGGAEHYSSISGFSYRDWLGANKELGVDVSYEVNGGRFSHFGMEMLDENTDYVYRITTSATGSASTVTIKFTLYSVADGSETLVAEVTKTIAHFLPSLENRYAVAYGAGDFYSKNENVYTGKTISFKAAIERPAESRQITLNPATVTEKVANGALVGFGGTYDYKGLGEYKVGDTLEFRFKGQNIPNVGLFVNKNGVNPIGGGTENTGIFLQTSGHGSVTYNKRLVIVGPYLVDAGGAEYYSSISGFSYRGWLSANHELAVDVSYVVDGGRFSHFGIEMLDENTDYVYRITTSATGSAGTVTIKCTLHSVTNGNETLVEEFTRTVTHYLDSLENRYAVAYGAGDYYSKNENVYTGKTITFEYSVNP